MEAIRLLNDRAVLLLLDDIWADEHARDVGQSTVFLLIQNCLRLVVRTAGRLRVVISTRNASVANLVPERRRVCAEPFKDSDLAAREMMRGYAELSFDEIENASSQV